MKEQRFWRWFRIPRIRASDLQFFCVLSTISLISGVAINLIRSDPMPWNYRDQASRLAASAVRLAADAGARAAPRENSRGELLPERIALSDLRQAMGGGAVLVLDARPELFHRLGHIPGAVSLPREDFEEAYRREKTRIESASAVVVYCAGPGCEDAGLVKAGLERLGHPCVRVFSGGWEEWSAEGLPVEVVR